LLFEWKGTTMKRTLLALPLLGLGLLSPPAHADPYLWCAVTGPGNEVCSFRTLAQCREVISEVGGACSPNLAYSRRDVGTTARRHHALRY
jgi:hypothetical protein